jgi:uncharacterized protein YkwD
MGVNWVDVSLVLVILVSVAAGWHRGFILSILDVVRWLGSWLSALLLYRPLSGILGYVVDWNEIWLQPIAFILILFVSSVLIQLGGRAIVRRLPPKVHFSVVNRLLGTIPGFVSGVVMAAIISTLLLAIPLSDGISAAAQNSLLAEKFGVYTDELQDVFAPVFNPAINQTLNKLIVTEPGSDELVELPFKVADSKPQPDLEQQMLDMVNHERVSRGLKPLVLDPELVPVARAHSADMFERGYFSHYTPEGKDPFQRMKDAGVKYRTAGENLALAPTLEIAHTGLMNSPGHRANILNPNFGRVGIGILSGGRRGIMVSQEFRN